MRKTCETCKHDDKDYPSYPYKTPCNECVFGADNVPDKWEAAEHYEPDTNADRIRSMSDEELAKFLCRNMTQDCSVCPGAKYCSKGHTGLIKWLGLPAEED